LLVIAAFYRHPAQLRRLIPPFHGTLLATPFGTLAGNEGISGFFWISQKNPVRTSGAKIALSHEKTRVQKSLNAVVLWCFSFSSRRVSRYSMLKAGPKNTVTVDPLLETSVSALNPSSKLTLWV
jgi:hypothetical protein